MPPRPRRPTTTGPRQMACQSGCICLSVGPWDCRDIGHVCGAHRVRNRSRAAFWALVQKKKKKKKTSLGIQIIWVHAVTSDTTSRHSFTKQRPTRANTMTASRCQPNPVLTRRRLKAGRPLLPALHSLLPWANQILLQIAATTHVNAGAFVEDAAQKRARAASVWTDGLRAPHQAARFERTCSARCAQLVLANPQPPIFTHSSLQNRPARLEALADVHVLYW
jgi:hypothetical protein